MRANDQNTLCLLREQAKVTPTGATNRARLARLNDYLRGLPHYNFTQKGCANICQRFGVSTDELTAAVAVLQSPQPAQPTPELLHIIGAAVAPATKHRPKGRDGR
jgi:hypothetical protein